MTSATGLEAYKDCQFFINGVPDTEDAIAATPVCSQDMDAEALMAAGGSCIFRYETELLASKFCVPTVDALASTMVSAFKDEYDRYLGDTGALDVFNDIVAVWDLVAASVGAAFVLGFVFMIVLRFFGGPLIWTSIFLTIGGTAYGGYMLFLYHEAMSPDDPQI
jgi:hypothetical protein